MRRAWYTVAYYLSWFFFALVGGVLNLAGIFLLPWAGSRCLATRMRSVIRWLFSRWVDWFHLSGVVRVRWKGFEKGLPSGRVYIANHPCLVDGPILLSRIPEAVCILKPELLRNPAMGALVRVACFESGENIIDLVHRLSPELVKGQSLLVFPEGTRTESGHLLGPLKSGFALVARRAQVPVQVITIRTSSELVPRGRAWWKAPTELPGWIEVELGPELLPGDYPSAAALVCAADSTLRELLLRAPAVHHTDNCPSSGLSSL